ncbi:EutP/PduV family microcompartment system protein [Micropruina sonneratiae]|uniref:EutP/PduV family microcompartment system protein n=1 Tax=Micropruina sonneratiae TaxID=2986940 RepID=UPI00222754DD|nr:EutP/PduV family microcompartment system protein [Micropruina sp. KQZ13P-5]MCW3157276.1 EutP/PduV family microcompartment system protein [Micropruina sp. KQZ13P-5]
MKRILLVGSVGCGKTTLLQALHGAALNYSKTETIYTDGTVMDTPGEYLELPYFKHALRLASYEVELVVLLASATVAELKFPPGFTTFFMPPSIGVVTKTDIASPGQIDTAGDHLRLAGVGEVLQVSAVTGAGLDALRERLA